MQVLTTPVNGLCPANRLCSMQPTQYVSVHMLACCATFAPRWKAPSHSRFPAQRASLGSWFHHRRTDFGSGPARTWLPFGWVPFCSPAAGSILIVRQSSLQDLRLVDTPLRKFALCLCPQVGAGVIMTVVHWWAGKCTRFPAPGFCLRLRADDRQRGATRMIAAVGALSFFWGGDAVKRPTIQILMGAGFGGLYILFGILIESRPRPRNLMPAAIARRPRNCSRAGTRRPEVRVRPVGV